MDRLRRDQKKHRTPDTGRTVPRCAGGRRTWPGALVGLVAGLLLAGLGYASAREETPEQAIKAVLEAQDRAWNKGDLEGFMAGYWKSEQLTFSAGGEETKGWKATLTRYRKKYGQKPAEMGKLTTASGLRVELLGDRHALVRGHWKLERGRETTKGLFTLVMRKFPEGWRIVHDHTSS